MKATKLFVMLSALCALAGSCTDKKEDPKPEVPPSGANTLTANAGSNQTVQAGQTVTLDGSASRDSDNKPFTYQWTFTKKPAASTVSLTGGNTAKPTFIPDETGEYEAELTIANGKQNSKAKVTVTATVASPLAIDTDINVKMLLEDRIANPNLPDYVVKKDIVVTAELTIRPGVTIAFERDARMGISSAGVIIAKGTAGKKIRFVGKESTKGYWAGISITSASPFNEFDYVEMLHGGSRGITLNGTKGNISISGGSKAVLSIKNSVFSQSAGYGAILEEGSVLTAFEKNTFSDNAEAGIILNPDNVKMLDAASAFTGSNGRNVVEVRSSTVRGEPNTEVVWTSFADNTPYRLLGNVTTSAAWKLEPGVTLEMSRDAMLTINNGGYLKAVGTPAKKITITGAERTAGYWKGIMSYSTSTLNQVEHAEISFGGSAVILSGQKANIAMFGNQAVLSVKNTKVSGSAGYGIFVSRGSALNADAATTNTFETNAKDGLFIQK